MFGGRGQKKLVRSPLPPTPGARLPGQDLKELVPQPARLRSRCPLAVALRAVRGPAPTCTRRGRPGSQPCPLGCHPCPALIPSPSPWPPRCPSPLRCVSRHRCRQRLVAPLRFLFSGLESGCGQGFAAFQASLGFGALFASLGLSFSWRSSVSRWLGDLPEVTRQARVAAVKVRASPGVVGDPPTKSPPECPSFSRGLHGTPWHAVASALPSWGTLRPDGPPCVLFVPRLARPDPQAGDLHRHRPLPLAAGAVSTVAAASGCLPGDPVTPWGSKRNSSEKDEHEEGGWKADREAGRVTCRSQGPRRPKTGGPVPLATVHSWSETRAGLPGQAAPPWL